MATALASLRHASFSQDSINGDVLLGVKIAELGKVACFSGPDGKPRYATITPAFVAALLSHAGNRSIPVHWTHDYKQGGGGALWTKTQGHHQHVDHKDHMAQGHQAAADAA
jgi:hypothetical protein